MGDPTRPTQPLEPGRDPQRPIVTEREVAVQPDPLVEEVRRIRFWSFFGSAVAVLAAVLGGIALVAALNNDDESATNANSQSLSAVRSDVAGLRSRVEDLTTSVQDTSEQVDSLSKKVGRLEQSSDQSTVQDDLSQVQKDLTDLNDRLDQVEQAQEEAASGGP